MRDSAAVSLFRVGPSWITMDFLKTDFLGGAEGGAICMGGTVIGMAGGCLVGFGEAVALLFLFWACFALGAGLGKLLLDFFSGRGGGTSPSGGGGGALLGTLLGKLSWRFRAPASRVL